MDAPRGRVDGQILRGSVLQKRKEEARNEHMSFEEAVVSAIDFHGGADRHRFVRTAGRCAWRASTRAEAWVRRRRTRIRRRWRRSAWTKRPARSRSTRSGRRTIADARSNPVCCRRPGHRLGVDGVGPGAAGRDGMERRPADESRDAGISQPVVDGVARDRDASSSRASIRKARLARRKRAKARWRRRFRRFRMRSTTRWESDCARVAVHAGACAVRAASARRA